MIAADTSSIVAYLSGDDSGPDVQLIDNALNDSQLVFPSVVLTELLSDPKLDIRAIRWFLKIPLLEIGEGFWERAGKLRSKIISKGFKARIADALIAQSCIDHKVNLISRDQDFRHFQKFGLTLA